MLRALVFCCALVLGGAVMVGCGGGSDKQGDKAECAECKKAGEGKKCAECEKAAKSAECAECKKAGEGKKCAECEKKSK